MCIHIFHTVSGRVTSPKTQELRLGSYRPLPALPSGTSRQSPGGKGVAVVRVQHISCQRGTLPFCLSTLGTHLKKQPEECSLLRHFFF